MQSDLRLILCGVLFWSPIAAHPQEHAAILIAPIATHNSAAETLNQLPDAPLAQEDETALAQSSGLQQAPSSAPAQNSDVQPDTPQNSSSQTATQTDTEKSQHEKAEEQLKEQEHQRVAGVMATFNTTSNHNALPLSPGQKFRLFFRSEIDPWPFLLASVVSGIGQADDSYPEWGQGVQGYAKRFGASYSDAFIGNFFGNAVLTSVLHEDPRYFQKGSGSKTSRFFWAASSTVWCKRDKGGWGPNYANIGGNLIGSAIARSYYPASERNVSDTITDGLTVSAEGIVGSEIIEFWPDLARHMKKKHDEKLARQAAQRDAQNAAYPAPQAAPPTKPQP
jgi:hypothetical protein